MRVLVEALSEGGIAPTAEAARHVERIGARTVGRSIRLRLRRLPEHAGRLARALAVLEQSDLLQAARLAGLDEAEAAEAAELLATAGILEPGRPLTFMPSDRPQRHLLGALHAPSARRGHRRAAQLLAEQAGAPTSASPSTCWSASPPPIAGSSSGWSRPPRAAGKQGAPESEAVFLRRALAEPPPPGDRSALLLDLGMAEASAGLADWPEHLQQAVDTAPNAAAAAEAAMVLGLALSRAQRFAEAVEVLDRAASSLDSDDSELALLLEAAAVIAGMNDPATASSVAVRREALRERAAGRSGGASRAAGRGRVHLRPQRTSPPRSAPSSRAARCWPDESTTPGSDGRPWFSFATWFSQATLSLLWAERYAQVRPLLDASIAQARATGDSSRLAVGLAHRGWLALRRGDLVAAEGDTRTALAATELPAPPLYRVLNGGVLVKTLVDQGELDAAEQALAPLDSEAESGSHHGRRSSPRPRPAAGRAGTSRRRARGLPGRRRCADAGAGDLPELSPLAIGGRARPTRARRARAGATPGGQRSSSSPGHSAPRAHSAWRSVPPASSPAVTVESPCSARRSTRSSGATQGWRERAPSPTSAPMLRRRNRRTEARELLREALDAAHRAGAKPLARQAETELRATGARPRRVVLTGLDSLTASERRIAELAGQGLTNREIAQTLFITARTVEGHLTSVFRKLDVDSRDKLPAALASDAPVPA